MLNYLWMILFVLNFVIIFVIIAIEYLNFKLDLEYSFTEEFKKRHFFSFPEFWSITLSLLSTILFFILAPAQFELEIPYTAIRTNNTIITGTHIFTSKTSPEIANFCNMMAVIMFIFFTFRIFMTFRTLYKNRKGLD